MRLTEARQVRMLKFMDVFGRWEAARLKRGNCWASVSGASAAGAGVAKKEGETGLLDRRIGKASGRRVPVDRCEEVEHLYRTRYQGFTARHFHEHLVRDHRFAWSYSWTKAFLQSRDLLQKAEHRGAHRRKRPRRPLTGMMLHQDASRHGWLAEGSPLDLVVTMDNATSEIYSAFLVEEEGSDSTFRAVSAVFGRNGLPMRGSRSRPNRRAARSSRWQGWTAAPALREGDGESASIPRWRAGDFPWPTLSRPLRQQRRSNLRTSRGGPRETGND